MHHNGYKTQNIFKLNAQTYQAQMKYYWASSRDFSTFHMAISEGSDEPVHPRRIVRAFVTRKYKVSKKMEAQINF